MMRLPLAQPMPKKIIQGRVKLKKNTPKLSSPAKMTMKAVARRLMVDLATVYNWKNRKKDPLPIDETPSGMMVDQNALLSWLADNEPSHVLTWSATADMSEQELQKASVSMNKADVLLMGIKNAVKEAKA